MKGVSALVKWLSSHRAVKYQLMWYLCCLRSSSLLTNVYQLNNGPEGKRPHGRLGYRLGSRKETHPLTGRELKHFQSIVRTFLAYQTLSNTVMVLSVIKYTCPELSRQFVMLVMNSLQIEPTMPAHCYLLGEFLMTPQERGYACVTLCMMNLFWRFCFGFLLRNANYKLDGLNFILQDDSKLYDDSSKTTRDTKDDEGLAGACQLPMLDNVDPMNNCFVAGRIEHKNGFEEVHPTTTTTTTKMMTTATSKRVPFINRFADLESNWGELSPGNSLKHKYKASKSIRSQQGHYCLLRPNRTRQAWLKLHRLIARVTIWASLPVLMLAILTGPLCFFCVCSNFFYTKFYPHCDEQMESLLNTGRMGLFEFTPTWHHLLTIVAGLLQNFCILFDSGLTVTYTISLAHFLVSDLLIYWRHLHTRIEQMTNLAKLEAIVGEQRQQQQQQQERLTLSPKSSSKSHQQLTSFRCRVRHLAEWHHMNATTTIRGSLATTAPSKWRKRALIVLTPAARGNNYHALEQQHQQLSSFNALDALQWGLFDVFRQIKQVDKLVSDFLTLGFTTWLFTLVAINQQYVKLKLNDQDTSQLRFVIGVFYFLTTLPLALTSLTLLRLYSLGLCTYVRMCSLMAHRRTHQLLSWRFLKLTEYFTVSKRTAFRLMRYRPYVPSVLITIIAWSFSCHVIVSNLYLFRHS